MSEKPQTRKEIEEQFNLATTPGVNSADRIAILWGGHPTLKTAADVKSQEANTSFELK